MKNEPFLLAKIKKAYIQKENKLTTIELFVKKPFLSAGVLDKKGMSKNPWMKLITAGENPGKKYLNSQLKKFKKSKDKKKIRIATKAFPLRWASAGGILILNLPGGKKMVPIIKRAPFGQHPNKLDLPGGMSSNIADMLYLEKLARREINEEIIITVSGKRKKLNLFNITEKFATHKIVINYLNSIYNFTGIVCLDETNAAIDTRNVFSVDIDSSNLAVTDGEIFVDQNHRPLSVYREIKLVEYRDLFKIPYNQMTPAFKTVLGAIKKNDKCI